MTASKATRHAKRSKSQRGGHLAPDPLPERLPWNDENAALLFEYLGRIKPPAEALADQMAAMGRIARECLADPTLPEGAAAQHWAAELLAAVADWRAAGDASARELAAFCVGEAWALLVVYARTVGKQRTVAAAGIERKTSKADARMVDLRDRTAKLPEADRRNPKGAIAALELGGWESPWKTADVTRRRVSAVLADLRKGGGDP